MSNLPIFILERQRGIYKLKISTDFLDGNFNTANNLVKLDNSGKISTSNLPDNVTIQGNIFNTPDKLVKLNNTGKLESSLIPDNVTIQGNIFNTANNLVKLDTLGYLNPAVLPITVTTQGNQFNTANNLVKLDNSGLYPNNNGRNIIKPIGSWTWINNYFNLNNNQDNVMRFDTQEINTDPDTFEIKNIGTNTCRIHIKRPGIYRFVTEVHLYDLYNDVDIVIKVRRASVVDGAMLNIRAVTDARFNESSADQILGGHTVIEENVEGFYDVTVNPSSNQPYPSSRFDAPTRLIIEKI